MDRMSCPVALTLLVAASLACGPSEGLAPVTPVPAAFSGVGSVEVRTITTSDSLDPDGYTIVVNSVWAYDHEPVDVKPNDTVLLRGLTARDHTLYLDGVARNCTGEKLDGHPVVVVAGGMTAVVFEVVCKAT